MNADQHDAVAFQRTAQEDCRLHCSGRSRSGGKRSPVCRSLGSGHQVGMVALHDRFHDPSVVSCRRSCGNLGLFDRWHSVRMGNFVEQGSPSSWPDFWWGPLLRAYPGRGCGPLNKCPGSMTSRLTWRIRRVLFLSCRSGKMRRILRNTAAPGSRCSSARDTRISSRLFFRSRSNRHSTRALQAAHDMGWNIVDASANNGRIEAMDRTFWFGFTDDIVVRITPLPGHSKIDVRSVSRVGLSDVGTNAKRIRAFLGRISRAGAT